MKNFLSVISLLAAIVPAYCQQDMTVLPDSGYQESFSDFICLRFIAADYSIKPSNENLNFRYVSQNTGYVLSHSMNIKGLSNIPNIGLGLEENMGSHLLINFFDVTLGYFQNTLNWNASIGLGYYFNLDKKKNLLLQASANLLYQNLSFGVGSYTDTTAIYGIQINGTNIGTFVKNVKYVNNLLSINPSIELLYRRDKLDYFIGIGYDYNLISKEKIEFYRTHIPINEGLYDNAGNPIGKSAIMPGAYIIKAGIVKEFGL